MRLKIPAQCVGEPRRFDRTDFDTKEVIPGEYNFRHTVIVGGDPMKLYADEDLTQTLNGQRKDLEAGDPVKVTAHFDLFAYSNGKPGLKLVALEPRESK